MHTEHLTARTFFSVLASPCQSLSVFVVFRTLLVTCQRSSHAQHVRVAQERKKEKHSNWEDPRLTNVDHVTSSAKLSHFGALLYILESNGAVIWMIIKGTSPTMRHVSRSHRVALDWFFDRINLEPKILIKYVDTKNQIADILTTVSPAMNGTTILRLFNIMDISFFHPAIYFRKNSSPQTMSKRLIHEEKPGEDERVLQNQNQCGIWYRRLSIRVHQR